MHTLYHFLKSFICASLLLTMTLNAYGQNKAAQKKSPTQEKIQLLIEEAQQAENNEDIAVAAKAYEKAIEISKSDDSYTDLPLLLFLYGQALTFAGDYNKALNPLFESMKLAHSSGDKTTEARSLIQIGIIHFFMKNWDQSLSFYQRAETLINELGNKQGLSIVINNIANIHQKKQDFPKAIEGYKKSLKIQEEVQDSGTICNTLFNMGTCYEALNSIHEADTYYKRASSIASNINDMEIFSLATAHLGQLKMKQGEAGKAGLLLDSAETVAQKNGYKQVVAEIFHLRSEALEKIGNHHDALIYFKKMTLLSDTLTQENTQKQINELQVKYETAEKETQIEMQKLELQRKTILQWVLFAGIVICLAILMIVNRYRQLVRKRNKELRIMNATKDKFFSMISHDLKNPAIAQRNALQMLLDNGDKLDTVTLTKFYEELLKSADMQVELLYSLLDWARVQTGRIPYNPTTFDLAEAIRNELSLMHVMLENKQIKVTSIIPSDTLAYGDKNMASTVIRNLLSNAAKFTNKGGEIKIEIKLKDNDQYSITIADNGTGMSKDQLNDLFQLDKLHLSAEGTDGEKGSGLGLIVCKELVERNGGNITVESTLGIGSAFTFTLSSHA